MPRTTGPPVHFLQRSDEGQTRGDRMCGRYTLTRPEDIAARFGLGALAETRIEPRFNVAPSQGVPVIVEREAGPPLTTRRGAFQPAGMKSAARPPPPINARSESLLERPMFRGAVAH